MHEHELQPSYQLLQPSGHTVGVGGWTGTQSKLQLQVPWRMRQWPTGQIVETMGHGMWQIKLGELAHVWPPPPFGGKMDGGCGWPSSPIIMVVGPPSSPTAAEVIVDGGWAPPSPTASVMAIGGWPPPPSSPTAIVVMA
jgi:hypothetical protein